MFGEPSDVEGECNARLFIADNYGDNHATIRCALAQGHEGKHQEHFERHGGGEVTITWVADERERCDHGCGQWTHDHRNETIACPRDAEDHEYSDCSHCHPGSDPLTCAACGKTYFDADGHRQHCAGELFACTACGENGVGVHVCPKSVGGDSDEDEFAP